MFASVLLLLSFIVTLIYYLNKRPRNFPPGPRWLPITGNLGDVKKLAISLGGQHKAFIALSEKYKTDILGLKFGSKLFVVVSGKDLIKQVLCCGEYDNRTSNFFTKLRCMNTLNGITCSNGEFWYTQRTFFIRHIRNLGFGKQPMDLIIKEEVDEILSYISTVENKIIPMNLMVSPAVVNTLWALVAGKRIPYDSPRFKKLLNVLKKRTMVFDMSGGLLSHFPWLRFIRPNATGYNLILELNKEMREFFLEVIKEHYQNWYEGRSDDFIYTFISEMKQGTDTFSEDQLIMVCLDIFIAGSHTTSTLIDFSFSMMIKYPDVQMKVQKAIDRAFKGESPTYNDKSKVPYVEAVLYEVERMYPITPITGPRCANIDTVLGGYNIPKETTILLNNYSVVHNVDIWEDPENFRPDRFLNDKGEIEGCKNVITFNLGKRRCLGEALARNFIFTFFTGILAKYTLVSDEEIDTKPLPGLILSPKPFNAKFIPR